MWCPHWDFGPGAGAGFASSDGGSREEKAGHVGDDRNNRQQQKPCEGDVGELVSATHAATSLLGLGTTVLAGVGVIVAAPEVATGLTIASGILLAGEVATDFYYAAHGNPNPLLGTAGGLAVGRLPALGQLSAKILGVAGPRVSKPVEALIGIGGGQLGGLVSARTGRNLCTPVL